MEQSGVENISRFIHHILFGKEIRIVKVDKAMMDYDIRLTNFYHQFQVVELQPNSQGAENKFQ